MSRLLSNIWAGSPLSASFSQSQGSSENLLMDASKSGALDERLSDKCELRIEGMTCGSCVEVRAANLTEPRILLIV